jgi:hypothetical protein
MQKLPKVNGLFGPILLWEHLCMKSEDDPEARIRELEQPLANTARASEISVNPPPGKWAAPPAPPFPPPPQPLPYSGSLRSTSSGLSSINRAWWILAAIFIIGTVAVPLGFALFGINRASHSVLTTLLPNPTVSQSAAAPTATAAPSVSAAQTPAPVPSAAPSPAPTAPAGTSLTISGIKNDRTIACNQSAVNISGISNKIVITGHCASLHVSGVQNSITVDGVDAIEVSGFNNQITYHTGTPTIENDGDQNAVNQG